MLMSKVNPREVYEEWMLISEGVLIQKTQYK